MRTGSNDAEVELQTDRSSSTQNYKQLTIKEHNEIYRLYNTGLTNGAIAEYFGRHPATISRSIARSISREEKGWIRKRGTGGKRKTSEMEDFALIDRALNEAKRGNIITAESLKKDLGLNVSVRTIKRRLESIQETYQQQQSNASLSSISCNFSIDNEDLDDIFDGLFDF